jgi:3-phosphoshikimate 1-carboxyvinyltransferase
MVAVAHELARTGVQTELSDDDVIVEGGRARGGATFSSYHDHRMAMAMAALAAAVGNSEVVGAECVSKTYPGFWSDATALGLQLRAA